MSDALKEQPAASSRLPRSLAEWAAVIRDVGVIIGVRNSDAESPPIVDLLRARSERPYCRSAAY